MNSAYADVQNINYAGGAVQLQLHNFYKDLIKNTPWVHLDIRYGFSKKAASLNSGGATGFGVRLLNDLVKNITNNIYDSTNPVYYKPDAVERNLVDKIKEKFSQNNLLIKKQKKFKFQRRSSRVL